MPQARKVRPQAPALDPVVPQRTVAEVGRLRLRRPPSVVVRRPVGPLPAMMLVTKETPGRPAFTFRDTGDRLLAPRHVADEVGLATQAVVRGVFPGLAVPPGTRLLVDGLAHTAVGTCAAATEGVLGPTGVGVVPGVLARPPPVGRVVGHVR